MLDCCRKRRIVRMVYSSSACMCPAYNREDPDDPLCAEALACPAAPDSECGWGKLFSGRLYLAFNRNYGMQNGVTRYRNTFDPCGTRDGGKENAPEAICREVARAAHGDEIEIWGDRNENLSVPYIDECIEGAPRLIRGTTAKAA